VVNLCLDLATHVHDNYFRVETGTNRFEERIICYLKGNAIQVCQLEMNQWHIFEYDRVVLQDIVLIVSTFNRLALNGLNIVLELLLLIIFELG
jgi:hypothetical protein